MPDNWIDGREPQLPIAGEGADHSWISQDKHVLFQHPMQHWKNNQKSNSIPIVLGKYIILAYAIML